MARLIDMYDYHAVVQKMREFFIGRGFVEVPAQTRLFLPHVTLHQLSRNALHPLPASYSKRGESVAENESEKLHSKSQ